MILNRTLKARLYRFEIDMISIISNGLVHHTPKQKTLKLIESELAVLKDKCKLNEQEIDYLRNISVYSYESVSRATFGKLHSLQMRKKFYSEKLEDRKNAIYSSIKTNIIEPDIFVQARNEVAKNVDLRLKKNNLDKILNFKAKVSETDDFGVFWLCSYHTPCAKDHEDYQGKVYFAPNWEEKVVDETLKMKINAYIRNKSIMPLDQVCFSPPYLTTRPYCKHYFVPISVKEALTSSANAMLKRHNLITTSNPLTERERARIKYAERIQRDRELMKIIPSKALKKDAKKNRKLYSKYMSHRA